MADREKLIHERSNRGLVVLGLDKPPSEPVELTKRNVLERSISIVLDIIIAARQYQINPEEIVSPAVGEYINLLGGGYVD